MAEDRLTNDEIENFLDKSYSPTARVEDFMLDMNDEVLTTGQYRQILRTLTKLREGEAPDSYMDFADILYSVSDFYDNVDKGDYDHEEYIQHLFENKQVPEELLKLLPRIEF